MQPKCEDCIYTKIKGDELPCRVCTLEHSLFTPRPAHGDGDEEADDPVPSAAPAPLRAEDGSCPLTLHIHLHFEPSPACFA